jgi:hypothetical protein
MRSELSRSWPASPSEWTARATRCHLHGISPEEAVESFNHVTDFLDINGRIPDGMDVVFEAIDEALGRPLTRFRPPTGRSINVGL